MRAVIVGAGEPPSKSILKMYITRDTYVIGADGGGGTLLDYGVIPDMLVGDFDSIDDDRLAVLHDLCNNILRYNAEKDETDLELCADHAVGLGASEVVMLGVTGGRFDHSYAALLVLNRLFERGVTAFIADDIQEMHIVNGKREFALNQYTVFSVLPFLGKCTYSLEGRVKYPAKELALEGTHSIGNSNVILGDTLKVSCVGSALLCINR